MRTELMTAFVAANCDTPMDAEVERLGVGAGKMRCPECEGDGNWGKFGLGGLPRDFPCPDCKGTGFILVSV
jgi:hypothetical protein